MFSTPFTQPQQMFSAWQSLMSDSAGRFEQIASQLAEAEASAATRANEAIDEYAKLMKATLAYQRDLATAWRTQMLEAIRTTANESASTEG
jgi:hypothetical protein